MVQRSIGHRRIDRRYLSIDIDDRLEHAAKIEISRNRTARGGSAQPPKRAITPAH
jgi:hypothetical protein